MSTSQADTTAMTDYLGMEDLCSEEARMVRRTAREFVNREVLPIIEAHAQAQTFPAPLVARMGELGFYGATLPERYGCAGLSHTAYGLLLYELERGDSGLRSFASVQGALVMWPIFTYGSEAQRAHTSATSATVPLVIHILVPFRRHRPGPSGSARVRIPAGLEPKSGSVSPKQPIRAPLASRGSHLARCASLP